MLFFIIYELLVISLHILHNMLHFYLLLLDLYLKMLLLLAIQILHMYLQ